MEKDNTPKKEISDWNIWKVRGKFFILRTTERPHDHERVDPTDSVELKATVQSSTRQMASDVMYAVAKLNPPCPQCRKADIGTI